jgi:hypothetical protein
VTVGASTRSGGEIKFQPDRGPKILDGCWAAVDVDGFTYTQRVICPGDPEFVEIVD